MKRPPPPPKKTQMRSCQESYHSRTITRHFSHHDSGPAFSQIVLFRVFMNKYRQYEEDPGLPRIEILISSDFMCLKFVKKWTQNGYFLLTLLLQLNLCFNCSPPAAASHIFFGFIPKFQIFFEKLPPQEQFYRTDFRVLSSGHNHIQFGTQLLMNMSQCIEFISKFLIVFEKDAILCVIVQNVFCMLYSYTDGKRISIHIQKHGS